MPSVLFVFTSTTKTLSDAQTGWYLPEAAHPYYVLAPHATIDFASPNGANPPVDEGSVKMFESDAELIKFLADETVNLKTKLPNAKKLSAVSVKNYDAIFYIGGHGPVFDLPVDPVNIKLASEFYHSGKIVSAVCHGVAALDVPFSTEDRIISLGGKYTKADQPFELKVVVDGLLLTGQNPAAGGPLAEEILKALHK
ncbi:ThiJ/PfpI [Mycena albidolilacea]|uniref:D-lactate dehydratase n=1 Tax=Mycena albidolilacea TaxID=1033008 RepID=A0AAD7AH12_9AGAR|nr:ThiJ/PfpI [Mycena albidolilacea]